MKKVIGILAVLGIVSLVLASADAAARDVQFNYQGRVKVRGNPFTGTGHFKFAIVNAPADVSYWSNDGSSTGGSEPTLPVDVAVSDGVFNAVIGDASLPNMRRLDPTIFNVRHPLHLRVWFSDGVEGFEHLAPDKRITNQMLLGLVAEIALDIYVDPVTGDDLNPGLTPSEPKRTIQAAWDALPALLEQNATIHLADGVYREEVFMTGKTVVSDATITLQGNTETPSAVRITGADEGSETTPVREYGLRIDDQKDLAISGVRVDYTDSYGVFAQESSITLEDCELDHIGYLGPNSRDAALQAFYSIVHATRVKATYSTCGLYAMRNSVLYATECITQDNWLRGIGLADASYAKITDCLVSANTTSGVFAANLSFIAFYDLPSTVSYNGTGVHAETGAVINTGGGYWVSYYGNSTNTYTERGGQIY